MVGTRTIINDHMFIESSPFQMQCQVGRLGGSLITLEANALEIGKGDFASRHEAGETGRDDEKAHRRGVLKSVACNPIAFWPPLLASLLRSQ